MKPHGTGTLNSVEPGPGDCDVATLRMCRRTGENCSARISDNASSLLSAIMVTLLQDKRYLL